MYSYLKEQAVKTFIEKTVNPNLEKVEKLIKMYGKKGFSVGQSLTWADLFIFELTSNILEADNNALTNFAEIIQIRKSVEATPRIAEYLKARAKTGF